jgi:hypothetical protein
MNRQFRHVKETHVFEAVGLTLFLSPPAGGVGNGSARHPRTRGAGALRQKRSAVSKSRKITLALSATRAIPVRRNGGTSAATSKP